MTRSPGRQKKRRDAAPPDPTRPKPRDPDAFVARNWPWLLAVFAGFVLWYELGGNKLAGIAGFSGLGWLAWMRLIKPRL